MPVETAIPLDTATFLKIVAWSIHYLLDPKRGRGKYLPSLKEIQKLFPNFKLTSIEQIENWIYSEFGTTNLEEIAKNQQKITEVFEKIEKPEKEESKKTTVPQNIIQIAKEAEPKGPRVSALGVLAELEAIEPYLKHHNQELSSRLSESLQPQIKSLIKNLGVKNIPQEQLEQVSQTISQEVARESLDNIPKVISLEQIPDVITDSIYTTLEVEPLTAGLIEKTNIRKIISQISPITNQIVEGFGKELETSMVLASILQITQLKRPDIQTAELIDDKIIRLINIQHPLATPAESASIRLSYQQYLKSYIGHLQSQIAPKLLSKKALSFQDFIKIQEDAHVRASKIFDESLAKSLGANNASLLKNQLDITTITDYLANVLKLRPISHQYINSLGLGFAKPKATAFTIKTGIKSFATGLAILANSKVQTEVQSALLALDKNRLEKSIPELESQVKRFESQIVQKRSLSYATRKSYLKAKEQLGILRQAQVFASNQPRRFQTYIQYFKSLPHPQSLILASFSTWETLGAVYGKHQLVVPRFAFSKNPNQVLSQRILGGIAVRLGPANFTSGFMPIIGGLKPMTGMGKSLAFKASVGLAVAGVAVSIFKPIIKGAGALLGGLALYFLSLGQAAFTGFMIGAAVGGTIGIGAGAFIGFQIGLALAPFTFGLSIPIFTALGAVTGGLVGSSIGGLAGGLIGYGLASGSTTAIATGVGAGVGGTVGGVAGGVLGFALVGAIPIIGPFLAPFGAFLGATIGAYIGATIGAGIGYLAGKLIGIIGLPSTGAIAGAVFSFILGGGPLGMVISAGIGWLAAGGWAQIKNLFSGAGGATATATTGILGAIGSAFSTAASAIWGGITSATGATLGFLSGAGNFILGLGSLSVPSTFLVTGPIYLAIGGVAIGGTVVGIATATALSTIETDQPTQITPPGENQYFTVTKLASPNTLQNSNVITGATIEFSISLKAKSVSLSNISIVDNLTVGGENGSFAIDSDASGNPISPPCSNSIPSQLQPNETWTCQFTILAQNDSGHNFTNSLITNTVNAKATPEGQPETAGSSIATITVGNPPVSDPHGWPTCGLISQGPYSPPTHNDLGYRSSIDINEAVGTKIYSTHRGVIIAAETDFAGAIYVAVKGENYITFYVHLLSYNPSLSVGNPVDAGTLIGYMDTTGIAFASHLHYMIRDASNNDISLGQFNSLVPSYNVGDTITSTWGSC